MLAAAAVSALYNNTKKNEMNEEKKRDGETMMMMMEDNVHRIEDVEKRTTTTMTRMRARRQKPTGEEMLTRNGAWEILDALDAREKKKGKKKKDALVRFLEDFRAVHTLAREVLPECETKTATLERVENPIFLAKAEKKPSVYVQRFKIDTTTTTGMVDNDDDAIEEEVERAVRKAVGLSAEEEEEEEDEAPCEVRVLETSEGVVASSSMDAVIVVVDFREKEGSVPSVSFGSDDDEEEYEEDNKEKVKKEELFEGGIVEPDLETSLKELHPFAISIRQLSKRIGEDNVFLVVTHCGDDYVEKRDWCELIDVPPENVTFCQSSFVHALSEDYNKNKSNKSSATYVDIPDRLVEWIDDWREERGKSLRSEFQRERETVHFFAALKDAYFIPFEKKKSKKEDREDEEEEEEEKEEKKKEELKASTKRVDDENAASAKDGTAVDSAVAAKDDDISKKVIDSHSRVALKTVSACFDRAIEGMGAGVISGAPAMAAKFDKNYASSSDKMITRNQLHYFVSKYAVAQYPAAFILAWAIPGPLMAHPVHLSNRFRIALCFAIVGGREYMNMETIATTLALGAGADGLAVLNASFEENDLERQENDDDDEDNDDDASDESGDDDEVRRASVKVEKEKEEESAEEKKEKKEKKKKEIPLPVPKTKEDETKHEKGEEETKASSSSSSSKLLASFTERVNAALSAIETSTSELRQNAENAIKDAFTIADRTVAKAERKAKKLTRKSLNRALDDGLITRKQALQMSKGFFRNAFYEYVVRDISALICGPRYLLFTQADLTQIVNSSMTFYVAEAACKTFLPDRFNHKEKLEIDGGNASAMGTTTLSAKSLAESEAGIKAKEYCDAASEKFSQTAESAKQTAEAAKVKAQEAAARAAQSAHDAATRAAESAQEAARAAQENAQKAKEAVWSYVSSISSSVAAAVAKSDDDSDLIDKSLDPNSYAAKLVPQIPSYKLAAAFGGPAMKKALAFNLPSLLADADCRNLGFTKSVWTGNSKELDDLFAKYDQEKRIRAVARKALVLCLQSSNKKSVAEELKKCGLMQSEKSKMHLKLEERQKEHKKKAATARQPHPRQPLLLLTPPPPPPRWYSPTSSYHRFLPLPVSSPTGVEEEASGRKETTATLIPAATDGKTTAKKDGDDVNDDEKDASPKSPIAVMKQQQKTLSEFNKIPLISSSKGKEETQKEAKNAFAAPFKRKNFSSEEGGDREEEEEEKKRSKGSEEGDAYGEDEDKNTPPTRAAPTARERTTLKETEEDDDDDEEAILGTDVKGEKSERISPVGIDKEEKPDVEEEKANEERAAREASKEATTTTTTTSVGNTNGEEEQRKMSVLELHFGKRKPNPPKELKYDQKPKEMEPNAEPLPEELEEWKQFAEQQLANLVNLMRQKIIDCFHVRIAISVMMIACPAKELREVLKDLRDMKVIGNTMRPYLIYLREILDGCGEKYRDKLDADMEFSSSDEDESSSSDDDDDDDDESDSEEIPEITRGNGPLATTAQVRDATKIQGCSSSSEESDGDNDEEDDNSSSEEEEEEEDVMKKPKYDRQRCQLFSKFLGRFMIENRVQEQVEAARLLRADECREFSNEECVQFLDLLQRQGKIMIDGPIIHVI
ncbi:unnamed protein product [Bathycoccus prasinos]